MAHTVRAVPKRPVDPDNDRTLLRQATADGIATVSRSSGGTFLVKFGPSTLGHAQTLIGALDMADRCLADKIRRGDWILASSGGADHRALTRAR